jgi:hypothetical protein
MADEAVPERVRVKAMSWVDVVVLVDTAEQQARLVPAPVQPVVYLLDNPGGKEDDTFLAALAVLDGELGAERSVGG